MNIYIPNSAFLGNLEGFIRKIEGGMTDDTLNISFNEKWISVHPVVLSIVGALSQKFLNEEKRVIVGDIIAKSRPYLQRMKLFEFLNHQVNFQVAEHEATGRFIPLTMVKSSEDVGEFITDMIPLLHTTTEQAYPIKYVLSELLRNVIEHSRSPDGAVVCAQYYKNTRRVSIGIADCGIGILGSMITNWNPNNSLEAICLALTPGITGTTKHKGGTEENAGAGLFFSRSIAKAGENYFLMYSGNALYKMLKPLNDEQLHLFPDPRNERCTIYQGLFQFPGTVVGIDISIEEDLNFGSLLESIREAYFHDLKQEKRKKYKKPRFT